MCLKVLFKQQKGYNAVAEACALHTQTVPDSAPDTSI